MASCIIIDWTAVLNSLNTLHAGLPWEVFATHFDTPLKDSVPLEISRSRKTNPFSYMRSHSSQKQKKKLWHIDLHTVI